MSTADVEAIGSHCQMPFCHQLDFLPFKCESCKGKFCLDHRTESAHSCPKAGEWARRRADLNRSTKNSSPRPNILTHEQQCSEASCKTLIHTSLVSGVHCDKCRRDYCLKHRFQNDHDCANLQPLGMKSTGQTQRERGFAALEKLRAWGASKKAAMPKTHQSASKIAAAERIRQTQQLKKTAKGDDKIPVDKRVYLYVEASSDTLTAKIPKGTFYYSMDYNVGRTLDLAAKSLQVANLNNRSESEEDKLRVFHVEGGRLLGFGEKLGHAVQSGNTIVLLRGVGADMAKTPAQTS
ncbi:AN1-like zinc finger protein [Teratosphaeria destructans]|uniref:AN1-like zinc finger protein n=1 Tax=Teratosphaeria destructans TaxID=418781 RepID=A0A9W7SMI4_9PEZI|nr:AN1-like zinc finger protein [Teratosphaeria destructans]